MLFGHSMVALRAILHLSDISLQECPTLGMIHDSHYLIGLSHMEEAVSTVHYVPGLAPVSCRLMYLAMSEAGQSE